MVQRVSYTDRSGKKCQCAKWYATFQDLAGRWHRVPGYTQKALTRKLEDRIRELVEVRQAQQRPDADMARWIDSLPERIRGGLVKAGLLRESQSAAARSISDHIEGFKAHLSARGTTHTHITVQTSRVKTAMDKVGAVTVGDLAVEPVRRFLASLRDKGRSARTIRGYVQALRQFTAWLRREGVLSMDPFEHLEGGSGPKTLERRALTEEEAVTLVTATATHPTRFGTTGPARSLLYRLCLETGLRRNETVTLERKALRLDATPPTVWVQAKYAKNRRDAYLPLRPGTAELLRSHVANMLPGARVFKMAKNHRTAEMLREDPKAARIPAKTADGVVDFHSLRHSMITRLARSGVHPRVAQELARHSTITLTMDVYSHVGQEETAKAVMSLPELGAG